MTENTDLIRQRFSSNLHKPRLRVVAEPFAVLAEELLSRDPDLEVPETAVALRRLKVAQDATLEAAIAIIEANRAGPAEADE